MQFQSHRFCIAPMMEWSDRHCRSFHRVMTRHARLYTEMVTAAAVLRGDRERLLGFDAGEHPVALQLGGSDPDELARAAEIGESFGYDEINLNVGCPSDRVQSGRFGACLMAEPELVGVCVGAMRRAVGVPVTVKCRIGIDDQDSESALSRFVEVVAGQGCTTFIIHARKAWLAGLSPKENRDVPPLDYDRVYRLKATCPELAIVLNGGIADLQAARSHLAHVDGVMLGRAAYQNPYMLSDVDHAIFGASATPVSRGDVLEAMRSYAWRQAEYGTPVKALTRHMLGLYQGVAGARAFRRHLSSFAHCRDATPEVLREAGYAAARVREEARHCPVPAVAG